MLDVGAIANTLSNTAGSFFSKIGDIIQTTNLPDQIKDVDYVGLFSNPWFMVPFVAWIVWMVYKQAFRDLIIVAIIIIIWWLSGTEYMQTLVIGDELQINKVLPVLFGGAVVLGFVIYMFFGRS
jgi:hypothetical protein